MKKTLFAVGAVFALAALAAIALTSRPELKATASDGRNSATSPNVETRVIERTVRVKRREGDSEARVGGDTVRYATVPRTAPAIPTTSSSPAGESGDDDRSEGDDDRHESSDERYEHGEDGSGDDHGDEGEGEEDDD